MTARLHIDLNCDLGEAFEGHVPGDDERMMSIVSSANIACGFHAGDPSAMRRAVRVARDHGVAVGAHPGFPDRAGFGRRRLDTSPDEVEDMVLYQVAALAGIVAAEGGRLSHVKVHGALYNMAAGDPALANAVARAVAGFDGELVLFALAGSHLVDAGRRAGLPVASEGFADRAYDRTGALLDRSEPGAVLTDRDHVVARAVDMAVDGRLRAADGVDCSVEVDTICLHGDTPGAVELAAAIRAGVEGRGVEVRPLRRSWIDLRQ